MKIETYHWKHNQPLAEDYIHHYSQVSELFEYDPSGSNTLRMRADWLDEQSAKRVDRETLVKVLRQFNQRMNNATEAMTALELLADEQTLTVVGGQQAGLFTGPMLVIHKAITLIQTAKQAAVKLRRPVVPIFWIAGEDHDFDEVNHLFQLSTQMNIEKIVIEHPTHSRSSISQLNIPESDWEAALQQLEDSLLDTEFKPDLMNHIRRIGASSVTLVDFFGQVIAWLFGSHGLVLMDSDDIHLRRIEGAMFRRLISSQGEISEGLLAGKDAVEQLGYRPQAEVQAGNANLFIYEAGERTLLQVTEDGFSDKKGELIYSKEQLLQLADTSPERFSNNVMTRPMMQEYLFPVLCTVLGPGEIAYWGLTRTAFQVLDMKMPVVIPRLEFTLLEGTIQKHMQKFDLSFADIVERFDAKRKTWLDEQDTLRLEERFAEVKAQFTELYTPILETMNEINPGMRKLGESNLQKIGEQIDFLRARSIDASQSQFDGAIRQLNRIRLSIIPFDKPQERVYNIFAYLNKYGDDWLHELIRTPLEADGLHRIIYI